MATTAQVWNGVFMIASYMARMVFPDFMATFGSGSKVVPSIPESPWISGAWTAGRMKGLRDPAYTGTSVFPIAVSSESALAVTLSIEEFP